jgi:hypothetical protein
MTTSPKPIYTFHVKPVRLPAAFFVEMDKWVLKSTWNAKGPETILRNKSKAGRLLLLHFKTHCKAMKVMKSVRSQHF